MYGQHHHHWILCPFQISVGNLLKSCLNLTSITKWCLYTDHTILYLHHHLRLWSTTECSQSAAWKTNQSLLMASSVKVFPPGRPTNSGSTIPRSAHQEGGVISVFTLHLGSAPAPPDMQRTPWLCSACFPTTNIFYRLSLFQECFYLLDLKKQNFLDF